MAVARRFVSQFQYTMHKKLVRIDCAFTVAAADSAGYGQTGLVTNGGLISAVYMHTSGTPASAYNPAVGYVLVQLADAYYRILNYQLGIIDPVTGSSINISDSTVMTVGVPYQIVTVGTSTAANWQAMGLPANVVPAVESVFIAIATGAGTGTGTVKALANSQIISAQLVGGQVVSSAGPVPIVVGPTQVQAGYLIFKLMAATNSSTTTMIPAAPADGAVILLSLMMDGSAPGANPGF